MQRRLSQFYNNLQAIVSREKTSHLNAIGLTSEHKRPASRTTSSAFSTITPEELLRDRLVFGISDNKVRERLLRESALTLKKTDEICRASESSSAQMKEVGKTDTVSAIGPA